MIFDHISSSIISMTSLKKFVTSYKTWIFISWRHSPDSSSKSQLCFMTFWVRKRNVTYATTFAKCRITVAGNLQKCNLFSMYLHQNAVWYRCCWRIIKVFHPPCHEIFLPGFTPDKCVNIAFIFLNVKKTSERTRPVKVGFDPKKIANSNFLFLYENMFRVMYEFILNS